jgi:hypothetical protein
VSEMVACTLLVLAGLRVRLLFAEITMSLGLVGSLAITTVDPKPLCPSQYSP